MLNKKTNLGDRILVTGGCGYIGSHTTLTLLQEGYEVIVLDNLCNSSTEPLARITQLTGRSPEFVAGDVRDRSLLDKIMSEYSVEAVIHFAGLKAVGESVSEPLHYYENNVLGTLTLCKAMAAAKVFTFVFSSSATVYGDKSPVPYTEDQPISTPSNPYGRSKLMVEQILKDLAFADPRWHVALLRYFNPVGAHDSGLIGEDPKGVPNNLLPYLTQVAVGKLDELAIFGNDYPTIDGTGVRDYIHVMDLVDGHVRALNALKKFKGAHVWNLGTGQGYSVLEITRAFQLASGRAVPYRIAARRPGDIAAYWADSTKAERDLGWKARRGLSEIMQDAWRWQSMNPDGYTS